MKAEFPPKTKNWFKNLSIHIDLGFMGFDKLYNFKELFIPDKKPRKKELTEKEKESNKKKSQKRVVVENAIGGMKRYRFLADRLRCHSIDLFNKIAGVSAALWNFNLSH